MRIIIVGVCASGTTTLARHLQHRGYDAHTCAQEHSEVPTLWQAAKPDVLICLDASMETIRRRRPWVMWGETYLDVERRRLAHARAHADLVLPTDDLTVDEMVERVVRFLEERRKQGSTGSVDGGSAGPI
ncbi:MAG TPA: hypothetical protein VIN09_01415 [Chloroflexota bacterium]|jgi:RNase adaptor protein for sRNA GlmZ degradation